MYQYLNWFTQGRDYPSGGKLLNEQSILRLKSTLLPSRVEVHESVQRYDGLGRVLFTPIYADFDGGDDCVADVVDFIKLSESEFNLTPEVFFSGNRGFHVFFNTPVNHAYPHLVVKKFMSIMCKANSMDSQMYTSRHLLRSEGSIHFKSGLYKTKVATADVMGGLDSIKKLAKKQRVTPREAHQSRALDLFINLVCQRVDSDLKEAEDKYSAATNEMGNEVAPCIKALIANGPVDGQNNHIITLIARAYNSAGVSMDKGVSDVMSRPVWMTKQREVASTFKSIYKLPSRFGCKSNETLRQYCDPFCPFNEVKLDIF
jgi:hypothetical protein